MTAPTGQLADAPLDAAISRLPGAKAWWLRGLHAEDRIYLLEAGPSSSAQTPLVLVHGLGSEGLRDFYPVLEKLSSDRRVLLFDLPGLARSGFRGELSLDTYVQAVDMVVAARLGERSHDLLGHSLGGAVALLYAARRPERTRKLVLASVAGILHREAFANALVDATLAPVHGLSHGFAEMLRGFGKALIDLGVSLDPGDDKLRGWKKLAGPQTRAALVLILFNMGPYFQEVEADTLLLWGARDKVASLRTALLLKDRIASSQLTVLHGVGHVPMAEAPSSFLRAVRCHLDKANCFPLQEEAVVARSPVVRCEERSDQVFRGHYERLSLEECERALIVDSTIGLLEIDDSDVQVVNTKITGGLRALDSDLTITGGEISGDIALRLDGCSADLAGVKLDGKRGAILALEESRAVLSATLVESPHTSGAVHAVLELKEGQGI